MSTVAQLVTSPERNSNYNRDAFVDEARNDCVAFGPDLDFDATDWNVSDYCRKSAGSGSQRSTLRFCHHSDPGAGEAARAPLQEPFGSVIKALVRLKKEGNPKLRDPQLQKIIYAARSLISTLEDRAFDPCRLVPADFDAACKTIEERGGEPSSHYRLGLALQEISRTLSRRGITIFPFEWKNGFRRITNDARVGDSAEKNRSKLPNEEILDELARLSHLVTEPSDLMLMAAIKLFHCAPWRVGEINTIPDDCWVEEQKIDENGPALDEQGQPILRYGIRYWPEKSDLPSIKWIPSIWVAVARSAIDTLLDLSAAPRALARWYERNPGRAWLPGPDLGPEQQYSTSEVAVMFGMKDASDGWQWLQNSKIPIARSGKHIVVSRASLEAVLLLRWEKLAYLTMDRRRLKRSQHLFLAFQYFHNAQRATNPCVLGLTTDQNIRDFLSSRGSPGGSRSGRAQSIFERFNSKLSDGTPMRLRTHQFRHWLNTVVQRGGLGQHLVARWSGRREISQNGEYDHMSGLELGEHARGLMASGNVLGALADVHERLEPTERANFRDSVFATAHVTEIGMCDADFITTPCPELGACPTCEHCNIKKGDAAARERAQHVRDDTEWLLQRAVEEMNDDTEGASNYVEAHRERLAATDRILAIHDNPAIPDGTWVRPNPESLDHFAGPALSSGA